MEISEFTLRLLLLFLPGIVVTLIIERFTVSDEKRHFYFIIISFIMGILSYTLYTILLKLIDFIICKDIDTEVIFLKALIDKELKIEFSEVLLVSLLAIILGFAIAKIINAKLMFRFAQKIGITKKFAEIDVWGYLFNSEDDELRWVRVRDIENNLCYEGWVEAFSDIYKSNELFIRDVKVYVNSNGKKLYQVPGLYVARDPNKLTIEFFALETDLSIANKENQNDEK
jgi:hypothetical protein